MPALSDLSLEQRRAFVAALLYVATIDDDFHSAEQAFVRSAFDAAHLSSEDQAAVETVLRSRPSIEQVLAPLKGHETARLLVRELVSLAHADGTYVDAERSGVARISDELGLSRSWLSQLEAWVADGVAWQRRGEALLGS